MAVSVIQGTVAVPSSTPGSTLMFPSNVTAGNFLIVFITWVYAGCPPSVSDSQGNSYTQLTSGSYYTFIATAGSTGANTVTLHAGCSQSLYFSICEVSGLAVSPYDAASSLVLNGSSTSLTATVTSSAAGDLCLGVFYNHSGVSYTYTATGSTVAIAGGGGSNMGMLCYGIFPIAGSCTLTATASAASANYPNASFVVAFKAAASKASPNSLTLVGCQ